MSLVSKANDKQLLDRISNVESLLQQLVSSGKRGPKPKSKMVKYTRDETKYDSFYIEPFESDATEIRIALINTGEYAGPVISMDRAKFEQLSKNIMDTKAKKSVTILDYSTTDNQAVFANDVWEITA